MSDMETARRAGGGRGPFTSAIVIILIVIAALFVWQFLPIDR